MARRGGGESSAGSEGAPVRSLQRMVGLGLLSLFLLLPLPHKHQLLAASEREAASRQIPATFPRETSVAAAETDPSPGRPLPPGPGLPAAQRPIAPPGAPTAHPGQPSSLRGRAVPQPPAPIYCHRPIKERCEYEAHLPAPRSQSARGGVTLVSPLACPASPSRPSPRGSTALAPLPVQDDRPIFVSAGGALCSPRWRASTAAVNGRGAAPTAGAGSA